MTTFTAILLAIAILGVWLERTMANKNGVWSNPHLVALLMSSCLILAATSTIAGGVALTWREVPAPILALCATALALQTCKKVGLRTVNKWEADKDAAALVVFSMNDGTSAITMRIRKNEGAEWPPLLLEVSNGEETLPAKRLPRTLAEITSAGCLAQLDKQGKAGLAKVLQDNGATHPMDIEGASENSGIQTFFEEVLLGEKYATQNLQD
jgi:hypothetical protein